MDDMNDDAEQSQKAEKPRGKCTGCAFDYQLGTARTGEHKGKLVIRKHNSRTGPGLCSGAQQPPENVAPGCDHDASLDRCEDCGKCSGGGGCLCPCNEVPLTESTYGTPPRTTEGHCEQGRCEGCCGCSSMCTTDPCGQPEDAGLPVPVMSDVVGVAPGGTPIVADPWTAPLPTSDQEDAEERPYTATAHAADGVAVTGAWTPTGTVLDRMTPEQRAEALGTANTVIGIHRDVMPPVSISEVHAENPPRYTDPNASRYEQDDNPGTVTQVQFTAPAPASLIPESTTTVSGQPEPDRDRWGRYVLFGQAHTRATTFAKLGANTKAIEAWNERNVIRGLTLRPDLLMLANGLEVKRDRNDLNSIAAQAKDAAGSKVAANIGTAYHAFSERLDAGLIALSHVPEQYRHRVRQYDEAITRAGLTTRPEWIERTTAVRADQIGAPLPVAGTLDRIFQLPNGDLVIGDLKTGSDLSYGEMEIEVQLALYAHGVNTHGLFDWNTRTWDLINDHTRDRLTVRTDIAIVVHLPADGDGCTLYVADIERGWRDAQRLGPLQSSLKEKKRFRTLMAADLASVAVPVERGEVAEYLAAQPLPAPAQPAPVIEPPDSHWEHAKGLFSSAPDQHAIAQLYQFALDSGRFHQDQLAVLVGLGKDRLNALARG